MTVSEQHNWNPRSNRPTVTGDVGGPFFTEKSSIQVVNPTPRRVFGSMQWDQSSQYWSEAEYIGACLAYPPGSAVVPPSAKRSKSDLEAKGTEAIARCKPTNSVADVATFLAELYREGLPRMAGSTFWKEKTISGRKIGDEYLNQEFGWKPMISDVRDVISGIAHANSVLSAYEHGSGSMVRRRYSFPEEYTESTVALPGGSRYVKNADHPVFNLPENSYSLSLFRKDTTRRKVWFSGAFTYHLPTGYKSRNKLVELGAKANALLGVELTPELLWNIAPWSWAVDWFTNAGDVISNLSDWATDGLVLKYGYVMEHSSSSSTYYQVNTGANTAPFLGSPVTASVETKQRLVATPFGFGLNWEALSPRQWSIISALGLSRGKR